MAYEGTLAFPYLLQICKNSKRKKSTLLLEQQESKLLNPVWYIPVQKCAYNPT